MRRLAVLALVPVACAGAALSAAKPLPAAPDCAVFPRSNPWNQRADGRPVHPRSAEIVRSIGLGAPLHPDFGRRYGIPYNVVGGRQRRVPVRFGYADESDRGPYPLPPHPRIEGGSDRHVVVVDRSRCKLYELYAARRVGRRWHAGSGAIWSLRSNRLRPRGWTSADAAGLPILPGLVRLDEVRRGVIDHALRVTVPRTRRAYVYPARHFASDDPDPRLPAMGQRLRLKRSFDLSHFPRPARVVLRALKRYGMIVADNGAPWYVSGAPSRLWNDDALHALQRVHGGDFEVVR
jgi:hypothetical protein